MSGEHSRDATLALQHLVQRGLLAAIDRRRPVTYVVAEHALQGRKTIQVKLFADAGGDAAGIEADLPGKTASMHEEAATMHAADVTMHAPAENVQAPLSGQRRTTQGDRRRGKSVGLQAAVVAACMMDWRTVAEIAVAVARTPSHLRNGVIPGLLGQGLLVARSPNAARHPRQAYRAAGAKVIGENE